MKRDLLDTLACPLCKGNLELNVIEEDETGVISGFLICPQCNLQYPIVNAIPDLRRRISVIQVVN